MLMRAYTPEALVYILGAGYMHSIDSMYSDNNLYIIIHTATSPCYCPSYYGMQFVYASVIW